MNFEKMPKQKELNFEVPESELKFSFSRSGGAGGQNVNKVETKVTVSWNFESSPSLTEKQKLLIENDSMLKNRISGGALTVYSQAERSQEQNRQKAVEILNNLVNTALNPPAERKETKVSKKEKKKRLAEKHRRSEKKELRGKIEY